MEQELDQFPLGALLPKKETQAAAFLAKYPEFDGRGIKIAIFDSGVDPGAPGLQITSDGKPKVIDMIDATGAGDVDTSTVVKMDENRCIKGLSGRQLKIPESWNCPSGEFHVGLKNAYELYTKGLRERIQKDYDEKHYGPTHRLASAESMRELTAFQNKLSSRENQNTDLPLEDKLTRENLQAKVDTLNSFKKLQDLGPTYDCIVFHDGQSWRAAIDTTENGELEKCELLGTYRETFKYGTLTALDNLHYAVNIYEEGNVLEIVSMCSSHGTHVASIAAAYFPDEPERNGVAPGAQIVSVMIGESRLGSIETGTGLTRALLKAIDAGCDLINMSYGEHSKWNGGRVPELIDEVINKHGIIYLGSAANHGPALSTIGTPPMTPSCAMIGVGAYVSPDMMLAEYSMRSAVPAMNYTWSSRGPTITGDFGVTITAPGAAVTSVPNWTLKKSVLMNGTSMSSPNCTGCVALILSGLKAKGLQYSPYCVKRALQNTASKVPGYDPLAMGHGLIQVDKAFEHLVQFNTTIERDIRFHITCGKKNGIYLREAYQVLKPSLHTVSVEPVIFNDTAHDTVPQKSSFEMNLKLVCDSPWVSVGSYLTLSYASRSLSVKIEPNSLNPGVNFTTIRAYDTTCLEKGPVFEVPVTVIKPIIVDERQPLFELKDVSLKPGQLERYFLSVPHGITPAGLKVKNLNGEEASNYIVHCMQLEPQMACRDNEFYKFFNLGPDCENSYAFTLQPNRTLEVCFGKWWSSIGDTKISLSLRFYSLMPECTSVTMLASESLTRINVTSFHMNDEINPSVSLKTFVQPLKPTENKIQPLKSRDLIPVGRQLYELVLTYSLSVSKSFEIVLACPFLRDLLYESEYYSQLMMLFDSNKQHLLTSDAYSEGRSYSSKLEKGDYTIKFQIKHDQVSLLEKLTDLPIIANFKLPSAVSLDVYELHQQALIDGKKFSSKKLSPNQMCPFFVTGLPTDKVPKGLSPSPGCYLLGTFTLSKDELRKKAESFEFIYAFDAESKSKNNSKTNNETKTQQELFNEALIDLKISWLPKLNDELVETLVTELKNLGSDKAAQLLLARAQYLDSKDDREKHLDFIISLANEALTLLNPSEILTQLSTSKADKKDSPVTTKNLEKLKGLVIDAMVKKGVALCDLFEAQKKLEAAVESKLPTATDASDSKVDTKLVTVEDIDLLYQELIKWIDSYDTKVTKFTEKHAIVKQHHGRLLKSLLKQLESKPTIELERRIIKVFEELNWSHLAQSFNRSQLVKYPPSYRIF